MGWLDGKVALVTGGGSGIGRAVVQRFVEEGARVGVLERVADRVEQLRTVFGDAVVAVQGDVTLLESNRAILEETVGAFGKLDIFVGNAGVGDGFVPLVDIPEGKLSDAFDEQFAVNVKSCFLGAKVVLPQLLQTEGCMIFTASGAGFNSGGGGTLYTASKHAVIGLVRQLAAELAPTVRVNGVAPGGTMTDIRGLGTLGLSGQSVFADPEFVSRMRDRAPLGPLEPSDHAGVYVLLASKDNSKAMTGVVVATDAGSLLRMPRRS